MSVPSQAVSRCLVSGGNRTTAGTMSMHIDPLLSFAVWIVGVDCGCDSSGLRNQSINVITFVENKSSGRFLQCRSVTHRPYGKLKLMFVQRLADTYAEVYHK